MKKISIIALVAAGLFALTACCPNCRGNGCPRNNACYPAAQACNCPVAAQNCPKNCPAVNCPAKCPVKQQNCPAAKCPVQQQNCPAATK